MHFEHIIWFSGMHFAQFNASIMLSNACSNLLPILHMKHIVYSLQLHKMWQKGFFKLIIDNHLTKIKKLRQPHLVTK